MLSQEIKPKKRLGQIFLKNKNFIEKIIKTLEIKENELIVEIGSGTGVLTEALLKTKAKVIAIEKDPELCQLLKKRFKDYPNFQIIQGDIRDIIKNLNKKTTIKNLVNSNYKLVGNIPYYLTSYLFRLLIELEKKPKLIVLMVQKEVGLRITAKPPRMNLLAVLIQTFFKIEFICSVPRYSFWPQPKVDSAIIKMVSLPSSFSNKKEQEKFIKLVKAGFSQPRKLFISNLFRLLKLKKDILKSFLEEVNIPPKARPETININQWFNFWQKIKNILN